MQAVAPSLVSLAAADACFLFCVWLFSQSLNKSRDSLLRVLGPSVRFIQRQLATKRTVLLVCEDGQWGQAQVEAGQIESHETNRTVSDCMSNMSVCVCVLSVVHLVHLCGGFSEVCSLAVSRQ
jgi:hypothetical protein